MDYTEELLPTVEQLVAEARWVPSQGQSAVFGTDLKPGYLPLGSVSSVVQYLTLSSYTIAGKVEDSIYERTLTDKGSEEERILQNRYEMQFALFQEIHNKCHELLSDEFNTDETWYRDFQIYDDWKVAGISITAEEKRRLPDFIKLRFKKTKFSVVG